MNLTVKNIIAFLVICVTIVSINEFSEFPIGNTISNWIVYIIALIFFINGIKYYYNSINNSNLLGIKLYLIWLIVSIVRGGFMAENYWDFKALFNSSFAILLVISVFVFTNPIVVSTVLSKWLKFALPLFVIFVFFIPNDCFGYYLIPISFFILFLPYLSKHWKVIVFLISFLVVFIDLDARSYVIKFAVPFIMSYLFYFKKIFKFKFFNLIFISFFFLPFLFLFLGITNIFNVFQMDKYLKGNFTEKKIIKNQVQIVDLKVDTRTFLYREVITSALKNKYVLIGITPARGNESESFGIHAAEELKTGRYERYGNEVSILNIFTWTGLVGIILYSFIFYKAAFLAIAKSNSNFLRILGFYLTFRWIYSWVEDPNTFNINNIILWMVIAICYSEQFREMTDKDFIRWLNSIFKKQKYLNWGN